MTDFFQALYGAQPWPGYLARFDLPTYATSFHKDDDPRPPDADADAYFGLGLLGSAPETGRGSASDVVCVPGAWADLDSKGSATPARWMVALLEEHSMPPTLVVRSGTGLHAYWLTEEPVMLEAAEERERWKGVVREIQEECRAVSGYTVDPTHDLARILRVPGSVHQRSGVAVAVVHDSGPRYHAEDLWALCPPERVRRRHAATVDPSQWDLAELDDAVRTLDADCYDTWIMVGMALRCLGETGYALWTSWSMSSDKYDEAEQDRRWDSFDPEGARQPGSLLKAAREQGWESRADRIGSALLEQWGARDKSSGAGRRYPAMTDAAMAKILHDHYAGELAFAGVWRRYQNGRWVEYPSPLQVADPIAADLLEQAERFEGEEDADAIKRLREYSRRFATNSHARAALDRAQAWLTVDPATFDANPDVLWTPSGLVDLRDGSVRPARPEDYVTKGSPYEYDPSATCPRWEAAMAEWMRGEMPLVRWLQRYLGLCLTGHTREHAFALWYGPTAGNGKSTCLAVLRAILGDYAHAANRKLFTTKAEDHSTGLAALRGARLVEVAELKAGLSLDVDRLKAVVSGDPIRARFMRQDEFEFRPSCKLIMTANALPPLSTIDGGIVRRARVVGWRSKPRYPVADYHRVLLDEEGTGILAWLVRGAQEWYRGGLGLCDAVELETSQWLDSEDEIGRYIRSATMEVEDRFLVFADLYESFARWCAAEGVDDVPSKTALGRRLTKEDWQRGRVGGQVGYHGRALVSWSEEVPF